MRRLLILPALAALLFTLVPALVVAQSNRTAGLEAAASPSLCFSDAVHGWLAQRNRVWTTSNGGASWRLRFRPRLEAPSNFHPEVQCVAETAWVLFVGTGATMNQSPYVLYLTADGGKHWAAAAEEGFFGSAYPDARAQRSLGEHPGPFAVASRTTAYFLGIDPVVGPQGSVGLNATVDSGRTWRHSVLPCLSPLQPVTIRFLSPTAGWVSGSCRGKATVLLTRNSGHTWLRHTLP
ncbi:MAG: hypothetical protein M3Z66_23000 [Chloroflexota bacterium]|nr:hypothetical protein [Chloroflexota bacterium]